MEIEYTDPIQTIQPNENGGIIINNGKERIKMSFEERHARLRNMVNSIVRC